MASHKRKATNFDDTEEADKRPRVGALKLDEKAPVPAREKKEVKLIPIQPVAAIDDGRLESQVAEALLKRMQTCQENIKINVACASIEWSAIFRFKKRLAKTFGPRLVAEFGRHGWSASITKNDAHRNILNLRRNSM